MQTPDSNKIPQVIISSLSTSLEPALTNASSLAWKYVPTSENAAPLPDPSAATALTLRVSGSWSGEITLFVSKADLSSFALKAAPDDPDMAVSVDAFGAAMKQLGSSMASSLEEHGPMTIRVEPGLVPDLSLNRPVQLMFQADGGDTTVPIYVCCDPNLIASAQSTSSKAFTFPEATPAANLDLVLDVALNVTLRFGQRQLALREVLDLTSGSVVELDRQVDEPVELVLDGRVIARGEAVIIDGSYGMRITQVVQAIIP